MEQSSLKGFEAAFQTHYVYRVRALNASGASEFSEPALGFQDSLKWNLNLGALSVSAPAFGEDGTLYVISSSMTLVKTNKLAAISPQGTVLWEFSTGTEPLYPPSVGQDGTVYFGASGKGLYAVRPNGTLRWANSGISHFGIDCPAVAPSGIVYVIAGEAPFLYAVTADGEILWKSPIWNYTAGPVLDQNSVLYVGTSQAFLAISPKGMIKASLQSRAISSPPVIGADGTLYAGSPNGRLYAIHPDCTLRWQFAAGAEIRSAPIIGRDGIIFVVTSKGDIFAVTAAGEKKWHTPQPLSYAYAGGSLSEDGTLYVVVGTKDESKLLALDAETGGIRWEAQMPDWISLSPPMIGPDGTVYASTMQGVLYAFQGTAGPANSPWPLPRHNLHQTGSVTTNLPPIQPPFLQGRLLKVFGGFQFELALTNGTDNNYDVEVSTNLLDWEILTKADWYGPFRIIDRQLIKGETRFYRTVIK